MVAMAMMSCLLSPTTNQHLSLQGFVRKEKNKPTNNKTLSISFLLLQDRIWFSLSHLFMPEFSKTFLRSLMKCSLILDTRLKQWLCSYILLQFLPAPKFDNGIRKNTSPSLGNHILLETIYSWALGLKSCNILKHKETKGVCCRGPLPSAVIRWFRERER